MKKSLILIMLLFLTFGLFSCTIDFNKTTNTDERLSVALNEVNYETYSYYEADNILNSELTNKLASLSAKLMELIYQDNMKNDFVFSPLSIYLAMTMLHTVGDQVMKNEIEEYFNMSSEEIQKTSEFVDALLSYAKRSFYNEEMKEEEFQILELNNSIWICDSLKTKQEGLDDLAKYNRAEAFKTPFMNNNLQANKDITNYVKEMTHGLIEKDYQLSERTLFALINTLYCHDVWNPYSDLETKKLNFKGLDKEYLREFIISSYHSGRVLETKSAYYFAITTAFGIKLTIFIPKEKANLADSINQNDLKEMLFSEFRGYDEKENTMYLTRIVFPSFETNTSVDVLKTFKEHELFDSIGDYFVSSVAEEECFISKIYHSSSLNINKEGITGAAVTIIQGEGKSAPMNEVYLDFLIDQGFGYLVSFKNFILFAGQTVE